MVNLALLGAIVTALPTAPAAVRQRAETAQIATCYTVGTCVRPDDPAPVCLPMWPGWTCMGKIRERRRECAVFVEPAVYYVCWPRR